ncbi:hypothetical protein [Arthrobacter sp. Soil764]|uniref:hypothetical protein n=1 Tax=Arthrobacter sp. Soil764 TaxID=1736403 RepID=UPI0012E345FB|nr:hypothetical protein [Arthrobacter sp. Soil764]
MTSTGDQMTLHPYWDSWELVQNALSASKPAAASAAFHRAVSLMPSEIQAAEKDPTLMPVYWQNLRDEQVSDYDRKKGITTYFFYPLLSQEAFAFAAVRSDMGSMKVLDSFCGHFSSEESQPCSAEYLNIVAKIREIVAANEVTDIKDVRKVFSPEDRVRLRSVWRAMRDAGQLIVEAQGAKIFFHRTAPAPAPVSADPVPFRKGMPAAQARLLGLVPGRRAVDPEMPSDAENPMESWPVASRVEAPLPKGSQRTRTAEAVSAGGNVWLQTGFSTRADRTRYVPTEIIGPDGARVGAVELDWGRLRADPHGDCVVSVDSEVNVRIYTTDGRQVAAFSLASAPEVREVMRAFGERGMKPSSAVRSVHASIAQRLLAISVIDHVFVYTFAGEVVAAFRLNEETKEHSFQGVAVSGMSRPDWAYFIQLAVGGEGLFIGAYSGLLMHITFSGDLIASWNLDASPQILQQTAGGVAGLAGEKFFQANEGETVNYQPADYYDRPQVVGSHVLLNTRKTSGVFDLESFTGQTVELPKPRRAAYLVNGGLVIETSDTRYTF